MTTTRKFIIYLALVILFFIFSQVIIHVALNTTYKYIKYVVNTPIELKMEIQASSISGFAKGKIKNNTENTLEGKYLKIDCYSKLDTLMGTKYVQIDKINTNEEKQFEVRFNFNKVDKAIVSIVDEKVLTDVPQEQRESDPEFGLATCIAALILLYFI